MTIDNWIDILAPIIGIIVAVVTAGATYYFTKKQEILAAERRLKEEYYLDFIKAVSNYAVSDGSEEMLKKFADVMNQLLLVGSADAVSKAMKFRNYIIESKEKQGSTKEHNKLLTNLIKSMRKDLYKGKKVNRGYPTIELTRAGSGKNSDIHINASSTESIICQGVKVNVAVTPIE